MLPACPVAVPILEGFFQMKLDGVNKLVVRTVNHHLIPAKIRAREQLKSSRDAIKLQSMILPDAQNASFTRVVLPDLRLGIVNSRENRIFRFDDANKTVLILSDAIATALRLFLLVQCNYAGPETETDQLVAAANSEHWFSRRVNEIGKVQKYFRLVVIEIAKSAAEHDGVGLELLDRCGQRTNVRNPRLRFFHQARNVGRDVLQGKRGNLSLLLELRANLLAKFLNRDFRQVSFIAQEIIYD